MSNTAAETCHTSGWAAFHQRINNAWHERALQLFMVVVLAHWAEHLTQALQIYVLGWDIPASRGILGLWFPWLVTSELLHYGYALVMLVAIWALRDGFKGRSRFWWTASLVIQFWHHVEHAILQGQALFDSNLFGSPIPTSLVQLWVPRVELHLFYNSVVFLPMVVAMYYHMFPSEEDEAQHGCSCAWTPRPAPIEAGSQAP